MQVVGGCLRAEVQPEEVQYLLPMQPVPRRASSFTRLCAFLSRHSFSSMTRGPTETLKHPSSQMRIASGSISEAPVEPPCCCSAVTLPWGRLLILLILFRQEER